MFYIAPDQYIQEGQPFTVDGTQYPANWLNLSTPEEKAAIGLQEVVVVNSPANDKLYWVSSSLSGAELTYTNVPKDVDVCKADITLGIQQIAYAMLSPSDWMVVRAFETGTSVPTDWSTYRAAIRTTSNAAVTAVASAVTIEDLASLDQIVWPISPADNN